VLDEMIAAGIKPSEVTMATLVRVAPSFKAGRCLALEAKDREWYAGRGFYEALFALPVHNMDAADLLDDYNKLPFQFETVLQNPIRQYLREKKPEQAIEVCLFPHTCLPLRSSIATAMTSAAPIY